MKTQKEKIISICSDGQWHCQTAFWDSYIRSPHKRRKEIEEELGMKFEWRPCAHGHKGVRDYKLIGAAKKEKVSLVDLAIRAADMKAGIAY